MAEKFIFGNHKKKYWIKSINTLSRRIMTRSTSGDHEAEIILSKAITKANFSPMHIVLLACFLECLKRNKYYGNIKIEDTELFRFVVDELNFGQYFEMDGADHIDSSTPEIFNIWKIVDSETFMYSHSTTEYLNRNFFQGYDLSAIKNAMNELYSNIADHSQSNGLAFSHLYYDDVERRIHMAACDFGLGIPCTLKKAGKIYKDDSEALLDSLKIGVTAQSQKHNKGFGLNDIISLVEGIGSLRIVSNNAFLYCLEDRTTITSKPIDFEFNGTLIYFDICVNSFEVDEGIIEGDVTL